MRSDGHPPAALRWFLIGNTTSMLGTGLVLPFTLIYLHQVRGIDLRVVGALLAMGAAAGLVAVPVAGALVDRVGARNVLAVLSVGQAAAGVGLAGAHTVGTAVLPVLCYGMTWAPSFPATRALLAALAPGQQRQSRAFAVNFTLQNAALGLGNAVGATWADTARPATFQLLFLLNAASSLVFAAMLTRLPAGRVARTSSEPGGSYRDLLGPGPLRLVLVAGVLFAFTGFAAFDSGLPAYATVEVGVSARAVALSLAFNTAVIVAVQLLVLRFLGGMRRSRALSLVGGLWAASWAVFGLAAVAPSTTRIALVMGFTGLFGVGETFLTPTTGPLVNDLAPEHLRGRANALGSLANAAAFVVSPALASGLIAVHLGGLWISLLVLACTGAAVLGARLRRVLSDAEDGVSPAVVVGATPLRGGERLLGPRCAGPACVVEGAP